VPVFCMYLVAAERQGVDLGTLNGTLQTDIFKEYIAQKEWLFPPEPHLRLIGDLMEHCAEHIPDYKPISVSGYHIREAGSTAAQELAFTLADGFAYVELGLSRGLDVDVFAPGLSFFFYAHVDFFEEIAKFRAARRIWAREMRERFGAENPRSWWLRFHTQTAGCSLTAQQPMNNAVRVAIQALAAVLGGTQSLHTNSLDEALALPSDEAVVTALRTQQIIAHESGVANTVDPLGGSYFVEALTNRTEREVRAYFERLNEIGGAIEAIERGYFQREIADSAHRYQMEIDNGERAVVGVNRFLSDEPLKVPLLKMDPDGERRHLERLRRVRAERDAAEVRRRLDELRRAAEGNENTMPYIVEAVKAYATLGETTDVLREVFGEYVESPVL
jgi:methylmalonyl-CoA mutase, N-terminal domain